MQAEVYSKPNCPYCVKAKQLLERRRVEFTETSAVDNREQLIERVIASTGNPPKTVPQIYIDGEYVGGYDQLVEYFHRFDAAQDDGA